MRCKHDRSVRCYSYDCHTDYWTCPVFEGIHQTILYKRHSEPLNGGKENMPYDFDKEPSDFNIPLVSTVELETKMEIITVRFEESQFGEYAIFDTKDQGTLRSSNTVMLKELHRIVEVMKEKNDTVQVTLRKTKRYYHFAPYPKKK